MLDRPDKRTGSEYRVRIAVSPVPVGDASIDVVSESNDLRLIAGVAVKLGPANR